MHFPLFPIPKLSTSSSTLPLLLSTPATHAHNLFTVAPPPILFEGRVWLYRLDMWANMEKTGVA